MKFIENAAFVSVGRASGFAGLAIFTVMFSLSFELALAAFAGGILSLGLAMILILYGLWSRRRSYKRTELWIILPKEHRPPASVAQRVIGNTLRETYYRFAYLAVVFSIASLVASALLQFFDLGHLDESWKKRQPRQHSAATVVQPRTDIPILQQKRSYP